MKNLLIIIILFSYITTYSQKVSKTKITGVWKVITIQTKNENPHLKPIFDAFQSATFKFNSDKTFELSTSNNNSVFSMMNEMTNNSKWQFDNKKSHIKIGTKEDNYSTMGIYVIEINKKIIFHLEESNIKLEVSKNN